MTFVEEKKNLADICTERAIFIQTLQNGTRAQRMYRIFAIRLANATVAEFKVSPNRNYFQRLKRYRLYELNIRSYQIITKPGFEVRLTIEWTRLVLLIKQTSFILPTHPM